MAVQAPKSGAKAPAGGGMPTGGTQAGGDPTPQIDQNMGQAQQLQNASNSRFTQWEKKMAVDEKFWKILEGVINDIKS